MKIKKFKVLISALLSAAMAAAAVMPAAVSAAGTRTKKEKYGDNTYARRFLSLYDDVIVKGVENGYLSKNNDVSGGFGVPYHSVEEVCVEAPDYGHETTSEAMSYIVWMAAMRDNIVKKTGEGGSVGDMAKAWKTLEVMIPKEQSGMMTNAEPKATLSLEWDEPEEYKGDAIKMYEGNTGVNPIHNYFINAYGGDEGLYLMHWLADVDDWYGYGGNGKFTFINTFQRGSQESVFETVPHPSVEKKKYGNSEKGVKGIFKTAEEEVPEQWSYTNAPDAEDRAIQAVYAANRWGVGDSSVTALAGKMGDQLRNNMFDKYYKPIGTTNYNTQQNTSDKYSGAHYLMSWYTSWGGAIDGSWTWQIGASHCHEFYQNPLAAFALLQDSGLKNSMKAQDAEKDYMKSLQRQMEFYLWLQSDDGPIAGGATSSWLGRYEEPKYKDEDVKHFGASKPSTFYEMSYLEHPVYLDPGSNHWIGNQVWAVQRLAEMYYVIKTEGDNTGVKAGGLTLEEALKAILDRWVEWFVDSVNIYEDDTYSIPSNLDWEGQPADWNGTYSATANSNLKCTIKSYGDSDLGCVSSLCNTLIYYAKANGAKGEAASEPDNTDVAGKALYTAKKLLDCEWELGRDDIGLSMPEFNGSLKRIFEQEVFIPEYYQGTMPNGDKLENGVKFIDFRSKYLEVPMIKTLKEAYDSTGSTEDVELKYHRFWHAGDIMLALGTMYELYGDEVVPDNITDDTPETEPSTEPTTTAATTTTTKATTTKPVTTTKKTTTKPTTTTKKTTTKPVTTTKKTTTKPSTTTKKTTTKPVTTTKKTTTTKVSTTTKPNVTTKKTTTASTKATTKTIVTTAEPGATLPKPTMYGDVNCDGTVNVADVVTLNLYLLNNVENNITDQGKANADCVRDDVIDSSDSTLIMSYVAEIIDISELGK